MNTPTRDKTDALVARWRKQADECEAEGHRLEGQAVGRELMRDAAQYRQCAYQLEQTALATGAGAAPQREQHSDDAAVDRFAAAMKKKLAAARAKGRGGWSDMGGTEMHAHLCKLLRHHVEKGDPRDVANFCMFLHQRGESILPAESGPASYLPGGNERVLAELRQIQEQKAWRSHHAKTEIERWIGLLEASTTQQPAAVTGEGEGLLPELPEPWGRMQVARDVIKRDVYTDSQMVAYARSAMERPRPAADSEAVGEIVPRFGPTESVVTLFNSDLPVGTKLYGSRPAAAAVPAKRWPDNDDVFNAGWNACVDALTQPRNEQDGGS
jgi:hypothetical protein